MRWTVPILALFVTAGAWYLTVPNTPDPTGEFLAAPEAELVPFETGTPDASVAAAGGEKTEVATGASSRADRTKERWKVVPPQPEAVRVQ